MPRLIPRPSGYRRCPVKTGCTSQKTKYALAKSETLSLTTSELDPQIAQKFVECVKNSKIDISIHAPSGSENQEGFQIRVTWTPTYDVKVIDGSTARPAEINMNSNGRLASSMKKTITPTGSVTFNIIRESLDKPISISAAIDGRESEFFTFPARPKYDLQLKSVVNSQGPIKRSGQFGNTAVTATPPLCLPDLQGNSQYLPDTAKAYPTGAGEDWEKRSYVKIVDKTPLRMCALVSSDGVACNEDKCYHETTGWLSAVQASIVEIKY